MEEIQHLINAASGTNGWTVAVCAWMALSRIVMKTFSQMLHDYLAQAAADADKAWINSLLMNRWYKFFAWFLDYVASAKLPSARTVDTIILKDTI